MTKAEIIAAIKEKLTALAAIAKHDVDVDTVAAADTDADDLTTANGGTAEDAPPSDNLVALNAHLDAMVSEGDRRHDSQHLSDLRTLMAAACADEPLPEGESPRSASPTTPPPTEGKSPSDPAPSIVVP